MYLIPSNLLNSQNNTISIPLHSCDYIQKISIKINVATDEGNSRNEIGHSTNDKIGVAVQRWL